MQGSGHESEAPDRIEPAPNKRPRIGRPTSTLVPIQEQDDGHLEEQGCNVPIGPVIDPVN